MLYRQDVSRCLAETVGEHGLKRAELDAALSEAAPALDRVRAWYRDETLPLLRVAERRDDLVPCREAADLLLRGATDIVFFGTGGSSLGAQALAQLAWYRVPGLSGVRTPSGTLRFHFFDNLDGVALARALAALDLKTTRFLVVSKSGGTPETVVQMVAALEALREAGLEWNAAQHIVCLSEPGSVAKNAVRRLAERHQLMVLDHDPGIGGRFSALSNVGLLPAMLMGLDAEAVREGARSVMQRLLGTVDAKEIEPAMGAAVHHALARHHGVRICVLMPYADRFRLFAAWFQQLWAESLGKDGHGTQPVAAAGPVDQHSQLQLYLDGPADKYFSILMFETAGSGPRIPESYRSDPLIGYLAGHSVGDLTDCQQRATAETLARAGRPVRTFHIAEQDERAMGALLMHFMLETILAGLMMRIDPFDQPAVERSKILTREYLSTM